MKSRMAKMSALIITVLISAPAFAASNPVTIQLLGLTAKGDSLPWTIVVLLTVLTVLPALLLSMTPFVRLLVIFHFLRQALGTQTTPSNQTLIGLALFMTWFLMQPVGAAINTAAIQPLQSGHISAMEAIERASGPARDFML